MHALSERAGHRADRGNRNPCHFVLTPMAPQAQLSAVGRRCESKALISPAAAAGVLLASRATAMKRALFLLSVVLVVVGCATQAPARRHNEQLYLAVEVTQDGKRLAAPKLVGFEGKNITAERRSPGASSPDYRLVLRPEEQGSGYRVMMELELPSGHKAGKVGLLHGEERTVLLDASTELKVMLMRVDSPEFRALMTPHAAHHTI
jgi:hypothetical protein